MADYATLKAAIQSVIKQNGNKEITGAIMQSTLMSMIDALGAGYQYMGVLSGPAAGPGTPDYNVFYLANIPGQYTGAGNIIVEPGEIAILKYNGTWTKDTTGAAPQLIGYQYKGVALETTDPGTPTQKVFYLASLPGVYEHFGNVILDGSCLVAFSWDGSTWTRQDVARLPIISKNTNGGYDLQIGSLSPITIAGLDETKYVFWGVLSALTSSAGTPTKNGFYIAPWFGTYESFKDSENNSIDVKFGEIGLFVWDVSAGYWRKESIYTQYVYSNITNPLGGLNVEIIKKFEDLTNGLVSLIDGSILSTLYGFVAKIDLTNVLYFECPSFVSDSYGIVFFDSNDNFVSSVGVSGYLQNDGQHRIIQVPPGVAYMKFSYYSELGARANNEPYFDFIALYKRNCLNDQIAQFSGIQYLWNLLQNRGAVSKENGTILVGNDNSYSKIYLNGATKIKFPSYKSTTYGLAFFDNNNGYISGYSRLSGGVQEWATVDVPLNASYVLLSYYSDTYCAENNLEKFDYVILYNARIGLLNLLTIDARVTELEQQQGVNKRPRPENGCESFYVTINGYAAQLNTGNAIGDLLSPMEDVGVIQLPENYTQGGAKVPLAVVCHGAGLERSAYVNPVPVGGKLMGDPSKYLVQKGYAVFDMFAAPVELLGGSELHVGNPTVLLCYKAGYDYVVKNYNVETDALFVSGSSMGGLSSFQIVQSGIFPVKAQAGFAPCIDLFKQAYCDPWNNTLREKIRVLFGFEGTPPSFGGASYPSPEVIQYFHDNLDKIIGFNPISRMMVLGDYADTFNYIPPDFNVESVPEEAVIYGNFRAINPVPIKIWHCKNDFVVAYRYSEYYIGMLRRAGQLAFMRPFETGGHNAWAQGDSVTDVDVLGRTITTTVAPRECYLWFERFR